MCEAFLFKLFAIPDYYAETISIVSRADTSKKKKKLKSLVKNNHDRFTASFPLNKHKEEWH